MPHRPSARLCALIPLCAAVSAPAATAAASANRAATAATPAAGASRAPAAFAVAAGPTGGVRIATAASARPRIATISARRLTLSRTRTVAVTVRSGGPAITVRLRGGISGRKVAEGSVPAGGELTLRGGALAGEELRVVAHRADGGPGGQVLVVGRARRGLSFRAANASWYGPGLFGNRTACGQTLTRGLRGVAHRTLPCGTVVTVRYGGRTTRARVVDRGPFHGSREFDLTSATARAIGFRSLGRVWVAHRA